MDFWLRVKLAWASGAARLQPRRLQAEMLSKIDFPHALIINDFVRFAVSQYRAVVDYIGAVANAERLAYVVVGNQHPDFPRLEKPDDFLDIKHRNRVDSGKWLVEQNETWLGRQRARDFDPPPLAARQADRRIVAQMADVQVVQQIVKLKRDPGRVVVMQLQHGAHVFGYCQTPENGGFLRQIRQSQQRAAVDRHVGHPVFVEVDFPAVERNQADHHIEAGGFAGAVRTQQANHFPAAYFQRHVLDDDARFVPLFQLLGFGVAPNCGLM